MGKEQYDLEEIANELANELNEVIPSLCLMHELEGQKKCSRCKAVDKFLSWQRKNKK